MPNFSCVTCGNKPACEFWQGRLEAGVDVRFRSGGILLLES